MSEIIRNDSNETRNFTHIICTSEGEAFCVDTKGDEEHGYKTEAFPFDMCLNKVIEREVPSYEKMYENKREAMKGHSDAVLHFEKTCVMVV